MKKLFNKVLTLVTCASVGLFVWLFFSWVEIAVLNLSNPEYSALNLIKILIG